MLWEPFSAVDVVDSDLKICSRCNRAKHGEDDFYMCQGKYRSECKACTIKKNVRYQQKTKSWRYRFVDNDEKRPYMADYYANHKKEFAEYRRKFLERNPDYHKEYARKRKALKAKKNGS